MKKTATKAQPLAFASHRELDHIIVTGACEHNLKNVDVEIPKKSLVVFTGVSGSGKSSLAFDTTPTRASSRYGRPVRPACIP